MGLKIIYFPPSVYDNLKPMETKPNSSGGLSRHPQRLSIDRLIAVVAGGGRVRTGSDVYNQQGVLLLEGNVLVADPDILRRVKAQGGKMVPIAEQQNGGLWDKNGHKIALEQAGRVSAKAPGKSHPGDIERRIDEIVEVKRAAARKYELAKSCIKQTLNSIRKTGGEFDLEPVARTVSDLVDFVTANDNSFAYLTREIFSYDDYLYNHSINVCTIGTVVMQKLNSAFSEAVNSFLNEHVAKTHGNHPQDPNSFVYFTNSDLLDISVGYFMHDLGKVLIDPAVLNKPERLTAKEFKEVKTHVTSKAERILKRNRLSDPHIVNVCLYHHAALYAEEERCYPTLDHRQVPAYVKVCKLADVYDAMTSKRCYKDAMNPVGVVTDIFHHYASRDPFLQYVLHSFIKSVGIYPAGSVVTLNNGQLAYVLDSNGPVLLPVTDTNGETLTHKPELLTLNRGQGDQKLAIDRNQPPVCPLEAYKILPDYLRRTIEVDAEATTLA